MKLIDATRMLRSKNAGPLWLTMDLGFENAEMMEKILDSGVLDPKTIAALYEVPLELVKIIPYPVVNAIKITIPRKHPSGALLDSDIYGCQQHMLLDLSGVVSSVDRNAMEEDFCSRVILLKSGSHLLYHLDKF